MKDVCGDCFTISQESATYGGPKGECQIIGVHFRQKRRLNTPSQFSCQKEKDIVQNDVQKFTKSRFPLEKKRK